MKLEINSTTFSKDEKKNSIYQNKNTDSFIRLKRKTENFLAKYIPYWPIFDETLPFFGQINGARKIYVVAFL